jgi:hypothetical protein
MSSHNIFGMFILLYVSCRALKIRAFEMYSQIPGILQITKESLKLCESDAKMWKLIFIRTDYLRIQFFLERLSSERGNDSKQKLVDVAREMLDMIIFLWLERDRSNLSYFDYDYVVGDSNMLLPVKPSKFATNAVS